MFAQGGIGLGAHLGQERHILVAPDAPRSPWPQGRGDAAGLALPSSPALDRGCADAEEAGGLGVAEAGVDGP